MKKLLGIVFLIAAVTVVYFGSVGWPSFGCQPLVIDSGGSVPLFHYRESFEKRLQG